MGDLINGEFELRGMQFGSSRSGYPLQEGGFDIGSITFRNQDTDNPVGDGVVFGRDSLNGVNYTFSLWIVGEEGEAGWRSTSRAMSAFRQMWHGSPNRNTPRAVDELRIWHGDRPGRVFGRARNYAEDRSRIRKGYGSIICDFLAEDDLIYDDDMNQFDVRMGASVGGGLKAPFRAPVTGSGSGSRGGFFTITGDVPTLAIVYFMGPVTNPRLTIVGEWSVCLNMSVAYDEIVVIDARSWMRTILRGGTGAAMSSAAGLLTQDSATMDEMILTPGTHEGVFTGVDPTNTSHAGLNWFNARHSV